MKHPLPILLAGVLCLPLTASPSLSQVQPDFGLDLKSAVVEVQYVDGSVVYMTLLDQNIEVLTAFGKLTVPRDQIQSIEFGQHLDPEAESKIQALIQQMGDSSYAKRELALKALIKLGHYAYPILVEQQDHKDMEIAQRTRDAIAAIEQKIPPKLLHRKKEDVIQTNVFTIVGKIQNPALVARAEFFGELNIKPSQLVAIRQPKITGSGQIEVDAAKYGSAHNQWLATGVVVRPGQLLSISASGIVDLVPPQAGKYMSGPYGWGNAGKNQMNVEGTLQGRIGLNGPVFTVGEHYQGSVDREGELYLHVVPCIWGNASKGSYQVKITVEQK